VKYQYFYRRFCYLLVPGIEILLLVFYHFKPLNASSFAGIDTFKNRMYNYIRVTILGTDLLPKE
jgi:hypothetical protein